MAGDSSYSLPEPDVTGGVDAVLVPPKWVAGIGWVEQRGSQPAAAVVSPGYSTGLERYARRATASEIAETKPKPPITALVSGEGGRLPLAYGRCVLPGRLTAFGVASNGKPHYQLTWCMGEISAANAIYAGNQQFGGLNCTTYLGTQVQGVDPWLAAVLTDYTDDLLGVCYSAAFLSAWSQVFFHTFSADLDTRKCYDPRTSTTIFTQNPAIQFRDAAVLGGLQPDDNTIEDTADECDSLLNGKPRRQCNIYFDQPTSIDAVLRTLAEYAGAFYVREGGVVRLIPDRPASVAVAFSDNPAHTSKVQIKEDTLELQKTSLANSPNRVITTWTDTSVWPWKLRHAATAAVPEENRSTTFDMQGWHSFEEANRHSIERLNGFKICDLSCEFEAFDDALELEMGDVFTLDSQEGLVAKPFRCTLVEAGEDIGHWRIYGKEYQEAQYSDSVVEAGTIPDTGAADPDDIPIGPTPTVTERLFVDEAGRTMSRLEISFVGSEWVFCRGYLLEVTESGQPVLSTVLAHKGDGVTLKAATGAVKQDAEYTIDLYLINPFGVAGTLSDTQVYTPQGKLLPPGNVPAGTLVGFEFGYFVKLEHGAATDIDLVGYRYKRLDKTLYLAAADDAARWGHASAQLVSNRTDSPGVLLAAQPVGTWMYGVRALDSLGQESPLSRWVEVEVTDTNAGQIATFEDNGTIGYVWEFAYENFGNDIGGFFATSQASTYWTDILGTGTNPYPADEEKPWEYFYAFPIPMEIYMNQWDTGEDRAGVWTIFPTNIQLLSPGAYLTREVQLKPDGGSYGSPQAVPYAGVGRYCLGTIYCNGVVTVQRPIIASYAGDKKSGSQTLNIPSSGQPYSFSWVNLYAAVPQYSYTLEGSTAAIIAFDSLTISGGQVRAWDVDGNAVAATIKLFEEGV